MALKTIFRVLFGALFIVAGVTHFTNRVIALAYWFTRGAGIAAKIAGA